MPRPQQRPARDRRQPSLNTPPLIGLIVAVISTTSTTQVQYSLDGSPDGRTLVGLPAVLRVSDSALPIAAELTASNLTLTYADAGPASDRYVYPQYDPAVRSRQGGYVAPQDTTVPPAIAPPTAATLAADGAITTDATRWTGGAGTITLPAGPAPGDTYSVATGAILAGTLSIRDSGGTEVTAIVDESVTVLRWLSGAWQHASA